MGLNNVNSENKLALVLSTSISQAKNKIHFYKNYVINKNFCGIFELVRLIILSYNWLEKHIKNAR